MGEPLFLIRAQNLDKTRHERNVAHHECNGGYGKHSFLLGVGNTQSNAYTQGQKAELQQADEFPVGFPDVLVCTADEFSHGGTSLILFLYLQCNTRTGGLEGLLDRLHKTWYDNLWIRVRVHPDKWVHQEDNDAAHRELR